MIIKKVIGFLLAVTMVLSISTGVFAHSYNSPGTNTTPAAAMSLPRHAQTYTEVLAGNTNNSHVAWGYLSQGEEEWFVSPLPEDSETVLSIRSAENVTVELLDANLNSLDEFVNPRYNAMTATGSGFTPYYVNIPEFDFYYIRVSRGTGGISNAEFGLCIGGPTLAVGSYKFKANDPITITSLDNEDFGTYDLTNIAEVPDNAIIHQLAVRESKTGSATGVSKSIMSDEYGSWISLPTISTSISIATALEIGVEDIWTIRLTGRPTGSRPYSITPTIDFRYVYQVVPE